MTFKKIPSHVAIVMDGNGRWAEEKFLSRNKGHEEGIKRVKEIIVYAEKLKIDYLTLFAFGKENWKRPKNEVRDLMTIFSRSFLKILPKFKNGNIKINVIGDRSNLCEDITKNIQKVEKKTKEKKGLQLNIAIDYSGRWEIIEAVKSIVKNKVNCKKISESLFESYLQKNMHKSVDLLIRTGGEKRISNFMNWQLSYSELYFCKKMWPDFKKNDFEMAIRNFTERNRRFGAIKEYER